MRKTSLLLFASCFSSAFAVVTENSFPQPSNTSRSSLVKRERSEYSVEQNEFESSLKINKNSQKDSQMPIPQDLFESIQNASQSDNIEVRKTQAITPLHRLLQEQNPHAQNQAREILYTLAGSTIKEQRLTAAEVLKDLLTQTYGKQILDLFSQSDYGTQRDTASHAICFALQDRNQWALEELLRFMENSNMRKRTVAVNALIFFMDTNDIFATKLFRGFADKNNQKFKNIIANALFFSACDKKNWAIREFQNFTREGNSHMLEVAFDALSFSRYEGEAWTIKEYERFAQSYDEKVRKRLALTVGNDLDDTTYKLAPWAQQEFQRLAKSVLFQERNLASKILYKFIYTDPYLLKEFQRLAKSEDINEQSTAGDALFHSAIESQDWANNELRRLAKSENINEREIAVRTLFYWSCWKNYK